MIDLSRWPRDDHYSRLRHNTFDNFEQVHRYVIEIGGLAITLMDDIAKRFGFTFKPVPREGDSFLYPCDCPPSGLCPCACHGTWSDVGAIQVYGGPGDDPRNV